MADRMNKNRYGDYQAHLLQRALEEKKKMEMDEIQQVAQQSSALQALRCYSPETPVLSSLWSENGYRWERLGERSRTDFDQQSLSSSSLPKQLISVTPLKSANDSEASFNFLQPARIPSPPFLLDHIENEDEFLYGKSDLSPVHQTLTTPVSSCLVESPNPNKKESSGWSDDDDDEDFSRRQSDLVKAKFNLVYNQQNVSTKSLNLLRATLEKPGEWNEPSGSGASRTDSTFDIFADNSPEILKSKFSCSQESRRMETQVSESQKKNDFFGLIPTSVSVSKPTIPDISVLLKNLKQIQMLQNLEPKGESTNSEGNDDVSDHLAPLPFIPIKNQITLNLKSKKLSDKSDTGILQTQKQSTDKSQLSKTSVSHSKSDSQNSAALLVSQFLQKLSSKQENIIGQNKESDSKRLLSPQMDSFSKNNAQGKSYRKESPSTSVIKKCESPRECLPSKPLKRSRSPDHPTLEYHKDIESLQKKHCSGSGNGEQVYEASKQKNSLNNIKEGNIHGILKVRTQDPSLEEHIFEKNSSGNSSDTSPIRHSLNRSPRRGSHDGSSRKQSRSPKRRSSDRSPRRRSRSSKRRSSDRSPRRRSRSRKRRSSDTSPRRRCRSHKRRSPNRSPRKKSLGRLSPKRRSRSRKRRSSDRSLERPSHDKSPQNDSYDQSPKVQQNSSTVGHFIDKNVEKIKSNKISEQSVSESSPDGKLLYGKSLKLLSLEQRLNESLQKARGKKIDVVSRGNSPQIPKPSTSEFIHLEDLLKRKNSKEKVQKLDSGDIRKSQLDTMPLSFKEINIKQDSVDSTETQYKGDTLDIKPVASNEVWKKKTIKKLAKMEPKTASLKTLKPTDSLSVSSEPSATAFTSQPMLASLAQTSAAVASQPMNTSLAQTPAAAANQLTHASLAQTSATVAKQPTHASLAQTPAAVASQPMHASLAQTPAAVTSQPVHTSLSQASTAITSHHHHQSMHAPLDYQSAYQTSPYGEVADPSAYSYYVNAMPYSSYSGYDSSSYNMYASHYPVENTLQPVNYANYYAESQVPQKKIPVVTPTPTPEEKHTSKKSLHKKDFRRNTVLVQVDSSAHSAFKKNDGRYEKQNQYEDEKIDKSEGKTETKDRSEDKIVKKGKSKDRVEKKDKGEDKVEKKSKILPEDVITPEEEKELLSRKAEMKKQIENLNSEYARMSKLQGEMMRKMRREKDGHKDHIITAYGRLQDEIKVQLTSLVNSVMDIDKELMKKVQAVKSSLPGMKDVSRKLSMAEKVKKERIASETNEEIPDNCEFYDPGGHWCQNCNKLTATVYDMLSHLRSEEHKEHMGPFDTPWFQKNLRKIRNRNEVDINKIYPIKGVQFILPVDGFYCSLCKLTFPDSAVAEDHIVSKEHYATYKKLVVENPVYERRRILDRLAGVVVIQKEENKRRSEAEKELANKRKKQEEEINQRKEAKRKEDEEKQKCKTEVQKKEEKRENISVDKTDLEAEKKNAIKLALLEGKKSKSKSRNFDESKSKPIAVYIGRAPNYKPRVLGNLESRSSTASAIRKEFKKDNDSSKDLLATKSRECNTDQKEVKKDSISSKDLHMISLHKGYTDQKETRKVSDSRKDILLPKLHEDDIRYINDSRKDLPVSRSCEGVSNEKEGKEDTCSRKDLRSFSAESCGSSSKASKRDSNEICLDDTKPATAKQSKHIFMLGPTVAQNSNISTGVAADNSVQGSLSVKNIMVHEISLPNEADKTSELSKSFPESVTTCDSSTDKFSYSAKNSVLLELPKKQNEGVSFRTGNATGIMLSKEETKKRFHVRGPLTEEETDLLLLGINKDDQLPLAIPKPPPSVIFSKSSISSPTAVNHRKTKGIDQTKSVNEGVDQTKSVNKSVDQTKSVNKGVDQPKSVNKGVDQTKSVNKEKAESSNTPSNNKNSPVQQDNPPEASQDNSFLEELTKKAKEYAEYVSTQSSSDYYPGLQSLPYFPFQLFYYYPTVQGIRAAQEGIAEQSSSLTSSGVTDTPVQASNSLLSPANQIPVQSNSAAQESTIQQQNRYCSPSVHTATTVQASISQKPATPTVETIISQKTSTTLAQTGILQKLNTTTVQANILQKLSTTTVQAGILQKQNTTTVESDVLQTQNTTSSASSSTSVSQGSVSQLSNVNCITMQTDFSVPPPVKYVSNIKSSPILQGNNLQKPDMVPEVKSTLKEQGSIPCPTAVSIPNLSNNPANPENDVQSSPGNIQNISVPQQNGSIPATVNYLSKGPNDVGIPCNVSQLPPEMNNANNQNVPPVKHGTVSQQQFTPGTQNIPTVPTMFSVPPPSSKHIANIQASSGKSENVLHPPAANNSLNAMSNTALPANDLMPHTNLNSSGNQIISAVQVNVSQVNTNHSSVQNTPSGQGSFLHLHATNYVPTSLQSNSAVLGNISQPPPIINYAATKNNLTVQRNASHFPVANFPVGAPSNPAVPGNVSQPPPNINYPGHQSTPMIQGNISQQTGVNYNPAIPGMSSQENIPQQLPVHYPPNLTRSSTVCADVSQPPPNINHNRNQHGVVGPGNLSQPPQNISLHGNQCAPAVPGNLSQPPQNISLHGNQCAPAVPGNLSQPPQNISLHGNQCAPAVPGNLSQSPQNISLHGNQCAPAVPGNLSQPPQNISLHGNQCAPAVPGNLSQPPPNIKHPGNQCTPIVPGNVSQPPPNINHPRNFYVPTMTGTVSKPPPNINHPGNHCVPIALGNVSHPPPNIHPGNQHPPSVLGNISQPPPNINHPGNQHVPAMLGNVSQPPPNINHHGNQHASVLLGNVSQPPPGMNHPGPGIHGIVSQPPGPQNVISNLLPPHAKYVPNEPASALRQSHNFPPDVHHNAMAVHVSAALSPATIVNPIQNHPVKVQGNVPQQQGQNYQQSTYSKPPVHANTPLLPTPNLQVKPVLQENIHPPCMPYAPAARNCPVMDNAFQQPNRCGTPPIHCSPTVKGSSPAVNSIQNSQTNSLFDGKTTNQIPAEMRNSKAEKKSTCLPTGTMKNKSSSLKCENVKQQQSKHCSNVPNNEQKIPLQPVPDAQYVNITTPVSVTSSSCGILAGQVSSPCSSGNCPPAPPGTEPVGLQSSHLLPEVDSKPIPGFNENASQRIPNSTSPKSLGEELDQYQEMDAQVEAARQSASSDFVKSQIDRVEKPLALTAASSGSSYPDQPRAHTGDVKAHKICSGSKNDSEMACPVELSTNEPLRVSISNTNETTQSADSTDNSLYKLHDEISTFGMCHDLKDNNSHTGDNTANQNYDDYQNAWKLTQPAAAVTSKSKIKSPEDDIQQNRKSSNIHRNEQNVSFESIKHPAQDNDLLHPSQDGYNAHRLPSSCEASHPLQEHVLDSLSVSVTSPLHEKLARHTPSPHRAIDFNPAPPGTEPVTDLQLPHLPYQVDLESNIRHKETASQRIITDQFSETVCEKAELQLEVDLQAKVIKESALCSSTPPDKSLKLTSVPNASVYSNPPEVDNKVDKAQVRHSDSQNDASTVCPVKLPVNTPLEFSIDEHNFVNTESQSADFRPKPENSKQNKICSSDQNNVGNVLQHPTVNNFHNIQNNNTAQFSSRENNAHNFTPWFRGPPFHIRSGSPPMHRTSEKHASYNSNYFNPAPPGTEPVTNFQHPHIPYYGIQRSASRFSENANQEIPNNQLPKSTSKKSETCTEMDAQINTTEESVVYNLGQSEHGCSEKALISTAAIDLDVSAYPQEAGTEGHRSPEICSGSKNATGATFTIQEPVNQPMEPNIDETNKKLGCGDVDLGNDSDFQVQNNKEHVNAFEALHGSKSYNIFISENVSNENSKHVKGFCEVGDLAQLQDAVMENKYEVSEPEKVTEKQNENFSNTQVNDERDNPHQLTSNPFHHSQNNREIHYTQSHSVHSFPRWLQASSHQHSISVMSSLLEAKRRPIPHSSEFLNPAPPGTEPFTDFRPHHITYHGNQKYASGLNKNDNQKSLMNELPNSICRKAESSPEVNLQVTKESNDATFTSIQPENYLARNSSSVLVSNKIMHGAKLDSKDAKEITAQMVCYSSDFQTCSGNFTANSVTQVSNCSDLQDSDSTLAVTMGHSAAEHGYHISTTPSVKRVARNTSFSAPADPHFPESNCHIDPSILVSDSASSLKLSNVNNSEHSDFVADSCGNHSGSSKSDAISQSSEFSVSSKPNLVTVDYSMNSPNKAVEVSEQSPSNELCSFDGVQSSSDASPIIESLCSNVNRTYLAPSASECNSVSSSYISSTSSSKPSVSNCKITNIHLDDGGLHRNYHNTSQSDAAVCSEIHSEISVDSIISMNKKFKGENDSKTTVIYEQSSPTFGQLMDQSSCSTESKGKPLPVVQTDENVTSVVPCFTSPAVNSHRSTTFFESSSENSNRTPKLIISDNNLDTCTDVLHFIGDGDSHKDCADNFEITQRHTLGSVCSVKTRVEGDKYVPASTSLMHVGHSFELVANPSPTTDTQRCSTNLFKTPHSFGQNSCHPFQSSSHENVTSSVSNLNSLTFKHDVPSVASSGENSHALLKTNISDYDLSIAISESMKYCTGNHWNGTGTPTTQYNANITSQCNLETVTSTSFSSELDCPSSSIQTGTLEHVVNEFKQIRSIPLLLQDSEKITHVHTGSSEHTCISVPVPTTTMSSVKVGQVCSLKDHVPVSARHPSCNFLGSTVIMEHFGCHTSEKNNTPEGSESERTKVDYCAREDSSEHETQHLGARLCDNSSDHPDKSNTCGTQEHDESKMQVLTSSTAESQTTIQGIEVLSHTSTTSGTDGQQPVHDNPPEGSESNRTKVDFYTRRDSWEYETQHLNARLYENPSDHPDKSNTCGSQEHDDSKMLVLTSSDAELQATVQGIEVSSHTSTTATYG